MPRYFFFFFFFFFFFVNSIFDIFIQFQLFLSIDLNECTLGTHNCHTQATCTNTIGSFTCKCNSGYSGNGVSCTGILYFSLSSFFFQIQKPLNNLDIDECNLKTDNCDSKATCTNTPGSFNCTCKTGYSGNGITCSG